MTGLVDILTNSPLQLSQQYVCANHSLQSLTIIRCFLSDYVIIVSGTALIIHPSSLDNNRF